MIETDVLYAYVKKEDWLKDTAKNIVTRIVNYSPLTGRASQIKSG